MKFFLPLVESDEQAERVLQATSSFTGASIPDPRVFSIDYEHHGISMRAEVGQPVHSYYREGSQPVIAILKATGAYAVCLGQRGVAKGGPILVGVHAVRGIEHFDATHS